MAHNDTCGCTAMHGTATTTMHHKHDATLYRMLDCDTSLSIALHRDARIYASRCIAIKSSNMYIHSGIAIHEDKLLHCTIMVHGAS